MSQQQQQQQQQQNLAFSDSITKGNIESNNNHQNVNSSSNIGQVKQNIHQQLCLFCIYVKVRRKMRAFVLLLDYEKHEMVLSRKGKKLRSTPFVALLEPELSSIQSTNITLITKEPNSYNVFATSRSERNLLFKYLVDITKNPIQCKCPSPLNQSNYQGQVYKKGNMKWSQRWMEIYDLQILCYKKKDSIPVNVISINNLKVKIEDVNNSHVLVLATKQRVFNIKSEQINLIYDKLVSIGASTNRYILEREKSLKLTPTVNPISEYNPIKFKILHDILKEPGVDLKELHRDNFASEDNSDRSLNKINVNGSDIKNDDADKEEKEEEKKPKLFNGQRIIEDYRPRSRFYTLQQQDNSNIDKDQEESPQIRRSIKELIDKYNTKISEKENPKRTYRQAVRISHSPIPGNIVNINELNQNNNSNNSSIDISHKNNNNSSSINNENQATRTTVNSRGDTDISFQELYSLYSFLIEKVDSLNRSCDEIIEWLLTNGKLLKKPIDLDKLLAELEISDQNHDNLEQICNVEKEKEKENIVNPEADDESSKQEEKEDEENTPRSTTTTTTTTTNNNNIQVENWSDQSSTGTSSISDSDDLNENHSFEEDDGDVNSDQENANSSEIQKQMEEYDNETSPSCISVNFSEDDLEYDGYVEMVVEKATSSPIIFNLSPMPKKIIPVNECDDYSLLGGYKSGGRVPKTSPKSLFDGRRFSSDVIPPSQKGFWAQNSKNTLVNQNNNQKNNNNNNNNNNG